MNTHTNIQTHPEKKCYLCGAQGNTLYKDLTDNLFHVDGKWDLDICSNEECQLVWLNPMPNHNDLSKLYKNYYTHQHTNITPSKFMSFIYRGCDTYYKKKYGYTIIKPTLLDNIVASIITLHPEWKANLDGDIFYLPYKKGGTLLDIGCGNGSTLEKMKRLGWHTIGIDFDKSSIETAQERNLDVRHGDLFQQNFKPEQFDAIIMSHVIEHLPDPLTTLKKCMTLLKQDGKLILTTPNINGFVGQVFKDKARHLEPPRHLHLFNKKNLHDLAEKAGFNNIEVKTSIRHLRGMWIASKKLHSNSLPLLHNIAATLSAIILGFTIKLKIGEGDELALIAIKQ